MQTDAVRYREALISFIEAQEPNCFVTLTINRTVSVEGTRRLLKTWQARVDRSILGPKWQAHRNRIHFVAILEKAEVNPHWHLAVRVDGALTLKFVDAVQAEWKRIVPSGTTDCKPTIDEHGLAKYITKEHTSLHKAIRSFVLSSEFSTI